MRAKRALIAFCVIFGATGAMSGAGASTLTRQTQKHARSAPADAQPAARPARQPASRPGASRQATSREASADFVAPRRAIAPQEQAQAALATQAVARGVYATGTPILPVSMTSGLSCVPFVRMATGMDISGDARFWWSNAAGAYHRGQHPERGAVLAFMGSGGMSRGHVAVVSRVVNTRTIQIDHSNWAGPGIRRGQVMRNVVVVDVSDRNDWTAVRVQVGHDSDSFGRTYPTHGFIYNRPAGSTVVAVGAPLTEVALASPHAALHVIRVAEALAD